MTPTSAKPRRAAASTNSAEAGYDLSDNLDDDVARIVADMRLQPGLPWDQLARRVATHSGRPIRIEAVGDGRWSTVTGVLSRMEEVDVILVRHTDSPMYRLHSVLHEFGHLLRGDAECSASTPVRDERRESRAESVAHLLARALYQPRDYDDQQVLG